MPGSGIEEILEVMYAKNAIPNDNTKNRLDALINERLYIY